MAHNIVMPALEMAQENGKLLSWRKKEGDAVAKGEPLLEIETDKAVVEIESPAEGILAGVKAHEGDVIPVGQTIAWIVMPGEKPLSRHKRPAAAGGWTQKLHPLAPAAAAAKTSSAPASSTARISPKARRLAKEHSIDLSSVARHRKRWRNSRRRCDGNWSRHQNRQRMRPSRHSGNNELDRAPDGRANHAKLDDRAAFFRGYESSMQEAAVDARENWDRQLKKRKACESRTRTSSWLLQRESW